MAFVAGLWLALAPAHAQTVSNSEIKVDQSFNHQKTGFPLIGKHVDVTCETCHKGGIFKGTPTTCLGCHNGTMASGKTVTHPPTSNECADCHNSVNWAAFHVDHAKITHNCISCHDGKLATGKNRLHIKTNHPCETCHLVTTWTVAHFDHAETSEPCLSCHDGMKATGKPVNHIRSSNDCGTCHKTLRWDLGVFDHTGITGGCFSCHNGVDATGKSTQHLPTSNTCENCHTPAAWIPVNFDHNDPQAQIIINDPAQGCITCHDGHHGTGRSSAHFATNTNDCALCHDYKLKAWKPAKWDHQYALDLPTCFNCHNGQRPPALGKIANHIPASNLCTDCHLNNANNFTSWAGAKFQHVGITTGCATCHNGTTATGKPPTHIATTNACESCHVIGVTWKPAKLPLDHSQVQGSCVSCHNGAQSISTGPIIGKLQGPTKSHLPTTDACDTCHSTVKFVPANKFDHGQMSVSTCFTCHNGTTATSKGVLTTKGSTHIATGNNCEQCHQSYTAWIPATFDHSGIGTARCDSCHKTGGGAKAMSSTHLPFNAGVDCATCHTNFMSFTPSTLDHASVTNVCFTCHNGTTGISTGLLTTKPAVHIPVPNPPGCESCHVTSTWKTAFNHATIGTATCFSCHDGKAATGQTTLGPHIPTSTNCATCHTTTNWLVSPPFHSRIDAVVSATACEKCHDGNLATGRDSLHILTSTSACASCHVTASWATIAANFHNFTVGTCYSCHDGAHKTATKNITGKDAAHLSTTTLCENCHVANNTSWTPAKMPFDHTQTQAACATCHDGAHKLASGAFVTGKIAGHVPSSTNCALCHSSTTSFKTFVFSHTDSVAISSPCVTCHANTPTALVFAGQTVVSKIVGHVPTSTDCALCHTNTTSFKTWTFTHTDSVVFATACQSCHDGQFAGVVARSLAASDPKAPTGHQTAAFNACGNCHTTVAFIPAHFDHTTVLSAGTPCASCHNTGMPNAIARPANHVTISAGPNGTDPAGNDCSKCHTTASWVTSAKPDHSGFTSATNCFSCHSATGGAMPKSATHFATDNACGFCHNTVAFKPANTFDHTHENPLNAPCMNCHDGAHAPALGKASFAAHLKTSNTCENCHSGYSSWITTGINHADPVVAAAACYTCHDGAHAPALGKASFPAHLQTSNTCENCHSGFVSWVTTKFNHADTVVAAATCFSCHDGAHAPAIAKSPAHVPTSTNCVDCHNTTLFTPAKMPFDHADPVVAATPCFTCHDGAHKLASGALIMPKSATHLPTSNICGDCHFVTAFKPAKAFDHTGVAPGTCFTCHNNNNAIGKPSTHIASLNTCDDCHNTTVWKPVVKFPHTSVIGACNTCHNGTLTISTGKVTSKSAAHISSTALCEACHTSTLNWNVLAAKVDHTQVNGSCFSCHDGAHKLSLTGGTIDFKSATHFATSNNCDSCHASGGVPWKPAKAFDHTQATGSCYSCHNGARPPAPGKDAAHLNTTNLCESCHVYTAWAPVSKTQFDHSQAIGACASCHDGVHKLGVTGTLLDSKSSSHFITTQPCDVCHTTSAWAPILNYTHNSPTYVFHTTATKVPAFVASAALPYCQACHKQNNEKISFAQPGLVPNCAACHSTAFKPSAHSKYGSVFYTFTELKDCTGACHIYTDQTLSKIKTTRSTNSHHRPTFSSWN